MTDEPKILEQRMRQKIRYIWISKITQIFKAFWSFLRKRFSKANDVLRPLVLYSDLVEILKDFLDLARFFTVSYDS